MKLNKPTRTVVELAPEPQEERVVFNATQRVEESASAEQESFPPLVQTRGEVLSEGSIPPLQPVQRQMRRVELAPVQPVAEVGATADPVDAGTDLDESEQEEIQQELQNEQANSHPQLTRVAKRQVVQLGGDVTSTSGDAEADFAEVLSDDQNDGRCEGRNEPASLGTSERIPALEPVVRTREEIPPLVMTRDGGALPAGITEIPALTAYNKMEVVHLLIGRSVEDEEVVLLQSFSERFVRSKKPEEFNQTLLHRIQNHVSNLIETATYDFSERRAQRTLIVATLNQAQQARGIEWTAAYRDSGMPTPNDQQRFIVDRELHDMDMGEVNELMREEGLFEDESFVFTWALVKVKIGHDFGSFKLSELMPTL